MIWLLHTIFIYFQNRLKWRHQKFTNLTSRKIEIKITSIFFCLNCLKLFHFPVIVYNFLLLKPISFSFSGWKKIEMMECSRRKRLVKDLNDVLTCKLCHGYLVDATTLVDCLHTCKFLIIVSLFILISFFVRNFDIDGDNLLLKRF